jgi:SAM-dependent methyltransferase
MRRQDEVRPELPQVADEQSAQDSEYAFPYHYVARFENGEFTQVFTDTWGINYVSTIEFVLAQLERMQWRSAIDVGCGDGRLTRELVRRFADKNILGIDYSNKAIALAKAMNPDLPGAVFRAVDILEQTPAEQCDLALLIEVYEHIPPSQGPRFLEAVRALMSKGGTLLLTVPHVNKPVEYKHFRHFDQRTLSQELQRDFEVVEMVPFERRGALRRATELLLSNGLFSLNHRGALNLIYAFYKRHLFHCASEAQCQRIFVRAIAR